jgi:carbonic anhydrase
MSDIQKIFEHNKIWADKIRQNDPNYFIELSKKQTPEYLWIVCSDSRVASNQVSGLRPGELFVHRNIANVVVPTDLNCLSVVQFAVEVLKIKHIIVCGHYGCGGIKAALELKEHGLIDNWLSHIRTIHRAHQKELNAIDDETLRVNRLCELNVIEQVANVCNTSIVQRAWNNGNALSVHGWIYTMTDGNLKDLGVSMNSLEQVCQTFRFGTMLR